MKLKTHIFLLAAVTLGLAYPAPAEAIREVLNRGGFERPAAQQESATLRRVRRFERPSHEGQPARFVPQERLAYTFFQDNAYTATVRRVSAGYGGAQVVESQSDDTSVSVISVYTPDGERHEARDVKRARVYLAVSQPDGTLEAQEYDLTLQEPGTHEHLPLPAGAAPPPFVRAESSTTVDLMIVVDTGARAWADRNGGGLAAVANAAVARMNTALANSRVACNVRLVRVYEPNYTYSGGSSGLFTLLSQLQSSSGVLSDVGNQRNQYGADVVTMFVDTGSSYGTIGAGYEGMSSSYAYSVCSVRTVNTSHTMSHEIGHNFGCGHSKSQKDAPGPGSYSYAAGWYFTGTSGRPYHTIMAYNYDGQSSTIYTPSDYFSTPLATHEGTVVGHASNGDNARCISQTMATVAAYRAAVDICVLTFDAQGGAVAPSQVDVFVGKPYGALPVPSRTGHLFGGWWTVPNGGGVQITATSVVPATSRQTLYAKWLATYRLTIREGSADGSANLASLLSGTVLTVRANDRTHQGLAFDRWTVSPAGANLGARFNPTAMVNEIAMPAMNVTLIATYTAMPGYLRVYVKPDDARGIQWSKDNGKTWLNAVNNGASYPVKAGSYKVTFRASHPGWLAPQKQTVTISTMTTNTVTAVSLVSRLIGTFTGWLADDEGSVCGTLKVTVGSNGKTTAKAALTNGTFSLTAPAWSVNTENAFAITLATKKGETLTLAFDAEQSGSLFPVMTGVLKGGALGALPFPAQVQRNVFTHAKDPDNPVALAFLKPRAGYYTVLLAPDAMIADGMAENRPEGYGYLGLTINAKNGTAKTAGKLPNGTAVSFSPTVILEDDRLLIPCFSLLHSKRGFYSGILSLEETRLTGDARWVYPGKAPTAKPPQTEDRFALALSMDGGRYFPVTDTPARFVALSAAEDEPPVADVPFDIDSAGKARFPKTSDTLNNPQKASFSLAPKTGIFKGKLTLTLDGKNTSVSHWGILAPEMPEALLGAGFYIVPDTWTNPAAPKDRYSIKRSFPVHIATDE